MENIFITDLKIKKVRHLSGIRIPLAKDKIKHLLITGKNGSGKTSLLDATAEVLNMLTTSDTGSEWIMGHLQEDRFKSVYLELNLPLHDISWIFQKGELIVAYYKADRVFQTQIPRHVEKVELKDHYLLAETPREDFVKFLLDLKMTEALAVTGGKLEKADKIKSWFTGFENLLKRILEEDSLTLEFNEDTFEFLICIPGREPFDFNALSSGYAAVLDIVVDLIIRMEKQTNRTFCFDMPGIVLVDEIETHLHLELQKKILDLLTTIFPNIQFVVSTHSPFVLNSLENTVIYDLENHILVEEGLADIPYEGIVEGYFKADTMSDLLRGKYERYKTLIQKPQLSDDDFEEIAKLELFLDEIPDYLALDLTTEYRKRKLSFENREDISW